MVRSRKGCSKSANIFRRVLTPEGQTSKVERIIAQITEEATTGLLPQALSIFKSGYGNYLVRQPI